MATYRDVWFSSASLLIVFSLTILGADINKEVINEFDSEEKIDDLPHIDQDKTWPGFSELLQVSGVAVDGDGNLHIFHRGDRQWDADSFGSDDKTYAKRDDGPITNDTVLIVDPNTGKLISSWGSNMFHLPHGITIDRQGNSWITDVALHQVFKFSPEHVLLLKLGEPFQHGDDDNHFCKPTDVAVSDSGYFFVSDGYCNSRILMFSKRGRMMKKIGAEDNMVVLHSLLLVPERGAVCVADREKNRIMCYSSGMDGTIPGQLIGSVEGQGLGRVFAIDRRGSQLLAVIGPALSENFQYVTSRYGVIIENGSPKALWGPDRGFDEAHDIAVSPDGKHIFVADVDVNAAQKVYKFTITD